MADASLQWFPEVYYYFNNENCHDNDNCIEIYHDNPFILIIIYLPPLLKLFTKYKCLRAIHRSDQIQSGIQIS